MDEPASEFDGPWKEALDWYFAPFLAFFFPLAHAGIDWAKEPEFVDKEIQKIAPESKEGQGTVDKLAKVWRRDGQEAWVYVHIEVQSQHETTFGRRMYTYNHRLEDRYGRMPVTLAPDTGRHPRSTAVETASGEGALQTGLVERASGSVVPADRLDDGPATGPTSGLRGRHQPI